MVDNLELLKPFLKFDTEDDFYYLQILQRKKDNPGIIKNTVAIKDYYIRSIEYLDSHYEQIKDLCRYFNARASLRLNKRSFKKVAFRALQNITAQMMQDDFRSARQAYSKACGQCHNERDKMWIVDIDEDCMDCVADIERSIEHLPPFGATNKIRAKVPTKTGLHLITTPFNLANFVWSNEAVVQKDNPTILYIP
jgi:hypothetical protein